MKSTCSARRRSCPVDRARRSRYFLQGAAATPAGAVQQVPRRRADRRQASRGPCGGLKVDAALAPCERRTCGGMRSRPKLRATRRAERRLALGRDGAQVLRARRRLPRARCVRSRLSGSGQREAWLCAQAFSTSMGRPKCRTPRRRPCQSSDASHAAIAVTSSTWRCAAPRCRRRRPPGRPAAEGADVHRWSTQLLPPSDLVADEPGSAGGAEVAVLLQGRGDADDGAAAGRDGEDRAATAAPVRLTSSTPATARACAPRQHGAAISAVHEEALRGDLDRGTSTTAEAAVRRRAPQRTCQY